jgi:hypothetical protein
MALLRAHSSHAAILAAGLSDPAMQPLFMPGAPAISTICGGLYSLPLFFCDKLATMPLSIL